MLNWFLSMKLLSNNNSNQYSVSPDSFRDIESFAIKSAFDWANDAYFAFAPTLVPERRICFEMINSFFSWLRNLYKSIIHKANSLLLIKTALLLDFMIMVFSKFG